MRYGLQLRTLDEFADPREIVRVAVAAEEAGWEALLVWDEWQWAVNGGPSADPWVALGACAAVTSRILLGTAVTPLARRRPHVVAQHLATLSVLSGGRVVFGAGLGGNATEFERFGEDAGERHRAAMLDEGLDVLAGLLSGERVDHHGEHYVVDGVALAPAPVRPIPIWIGARSTRARSARAARWHGWLADGSDDERNVYHAGGDGRARRDAPRERRAGRLRRLLHRATRRRPISPRTPPRASRGRIENLRVTTRPTCSSASAAGRRARPLSAAKLGRHGSRLLERHARRATASPRTAPARCGSGQPAAPPATTR